MHPPAFDRPAPWYVRLRRVVRILSLIRDLTHSLLLVSFGLLLGGVAGALIGSRWRTDSVLWAGVAAGAVLGATAGGLAAKRLFFSEPCRAPEPTPLAPEPGAPRWPGVEEQFQKILWRFRILLAFLIAPFLFLCYLKFAQEAGLPPPSWLPANALTWGSLGIMIAAGLLMLLVIRCPKCGGVLWGAAKIYQCPHCGVVLRD